MTFFEGPAFELVLADLGNIVRQGQTLGIRHANGLVSQSVGGLKIASRVHKRLP
jgi:hypothetical protein